MGNPAKGMAREAASSDAFRAVARGGYVAIGVVHVLIGLIAIAVALGGEGDSNQSGAFLAIAAAPLGFVLLWVLAIALGALGAWQVIAGVLARVPGQKTSTGLHRWAARLGAWGQAVVYLALGFLAAGVALGGDPDGDQTASDTSREVLQLPGGPLLLGAGGLAVLGGGIAFVVIGIRRGFAKRMSIPDGAVGRTVTTLGVAGFIAKGIALAIVGALLVTAAFTIDAEATGGLDLAMSTLLRLPFGAVLVGAVGIGFIAYGVFCGFRARYAKL